MTLSPYTADYGTDKLNLTAFSPSENKWYIMIGIDFLADTFSNLYQVEPQPMPAISPGFDL